MLKVASYDIVFQEIPDETTLALNLSQCPNHCDGCHSPHLRQDTGKVLDIDLLVDLYEHNESAVTCICFMGGDGDPTALENLIEDFRSEFTIRDKETGFKKYVGPKIGWYSGNDWLPRDFKTELFDYIKLGHYDKELGPLNKPTTNQRLYAYNPCWSCWSSIGKSWKDITSNFWKNGNNA